MQIQVDQNIPHFCQICWNFSAGLPPHPPRQKKKNPSEKIEMFQFFFLNVNSQETKCFDLGQMKYFIQPETNFEIFFSLPKIFILGKQFKKISMASKPRPHLFVQLFFKAPRG